MSCGPIDPCFLIHVFSIYILIYLYIYRVRVVAMTCLVVVHTFCRWPVDYSGHYYYYYLFMKHSYSIIHFRFYTHKKVKLQVRLKTTGNYRKALPSNLALNLKKYKYKYIFIILKSICV